MTAQCFLIAESSCIVYYQSILNSVCSVIYFFWTVGRNNMYGRSIDNQRIVFNIGADRSFKFAMNGVILKQGSSFFQYCLVCSSSNNNCTEPELISFSCSGHKFPCQ